MFGLGPMELLALAVVILLLFGNRLPSVMRSLGQGVVEFKKGISGIGEDVDQAGKKPERSKLPDDGPSPQRDVEQESSDPSVQR